MTLAIEVKNTDSPMLTKVALTNHLKSIQTAEKELEYLKDKFELVTDSKRLMSYIQQAIKSKVIAIDTETTGLDEFRDSMVGFSLATPNNKAIYVPILHRDVLTGRLVPNQMPIADVTKAMQMIADSGIEIAMHNANFDSRFILHATGVRVVATWDTGIMARLLNENEKSFGLKPLYDKYIGKVGKSRQFNDLFGGKRFDIVPIEVGYVYAGNDALITLELYLFQLSMVTGDNAKRYGLEEYLDVFRNIEMKLQPIVMDLEELGVKYDPVYGAEMERVYEQILLDKEEEFNQAVEQYKDKIIAWQDRYRIRQTKQFETGMKLEYPVNYSSPKQLAILLYDIIGLDKGKRKRGDERSCDRKYLKQYDHPVVKALQEIGLVKKQLTTYIRAFPILAEYDGRIHTHFNQVGTVTYRFSSNRANL